MIGFGELRRLSAQWQADIATVERAYAIDWLLKGVFDQPLLAATLTLRGSAALRYAHCADYPLVEEPEFLATGLAAGARREAIEEAIASAAQTSGVKFALVELHPGSARIEYAGPLGRRSAAQPRIVVSLIAGQTRVPSVRVPLVHPFSDQCECVVSAIALEEFAAERMAGLSAMPRVRDVFDLWFALGRAAGPLDLPRAKELAIQIAVDKKFAPPDWDELFAPTRRKALEGAWDNALRRIPAHPPFFQVEKDLANALRDPKP
jgi:hypothetical protein